MIYLLFTRDRGEQQLRGHVINGNPSSYWLALFKTENYYEQSRSRLKLLMDWWWSREKNTLGQKLPHGIVNIIIFFLLLNTVCNCRNTEHIFDCKVRVDFRGKPRMSLVNSSFSFLFNALRFSPNRLFVSMKTINTEKTGYLFSWSM
jgi:hypothetical protein